MERMKWALIGGLIFFGIALGAFYYGRTQCPPCASYNQAELLSELLVPTQKVLLVEQHATLKYDWQLYSTWPNLATFFAQLGFRKNAQGYVQYGAKFYYGYDLSNRASWVLKKEGSHFVFEAPPLRMLTCPSVLSQSVSVTTNVGSIFVDEAGREKEVLRMSTAQALAAGHNVLRDPLQVEKIRKSADQELRALVINLARPMGWQVQAGDVQIVSHAATVDVPVEWTPGTKDGGALDAATMEQLKKAGCIWAI